jgi:hypothetical protein
MRCHGVELVASCLARFALCGREAGAPSQSGRLLLHLRRRNLQGGRVAHGVRCVWAGNGHRGRAVVLLRANPANIWGIGHAAFHTPRRRECAASHRVSVAAARCAHLVSCGLSGNDLVVPATTQDTSTSSRIASEPSRPGCESSITVAQPKQPTTFAYGGLAMARRRWSLTRPLPRHAAPQGADTPARTPR